LEPEFRTRVELVNKGFADPRVWPLRHRNTYPRIITGRKDRERKAGGIRDHCTTTRRGLSTCGVKHYRVSVIDTGIDIVGTVALLSQLRG
jgi:hypothetical protein